MDDKNLINRISDAVQPPEKSGFDAVRRRIEAQSDTQREQIRRETLMMLEEKPRFSSNFRRIAAFAASAAVIIGLGAALIGIGLGAVSQNMAVMDSMAEESVVEDSAEEIFEDIPVESTSEETTDGELNSETPATDSSTDNDGSAPQNANTTSAEIGHEYITHKIGALGITIDLPVDAYVTDRSVSPDFELLEVYDISAAQLEANYRARDIYYNAMWYDGDADVTEIVISMKNDDISADIFDMNSANEEQLAKIEELYGNYEVNIDAVVGAKYYDVSLVEHDQALFFRAEGVVSNRSGRSNHLQYMTIINGCRIEITLIEHFGIDGELTGEEPEDISQKHSEMMAHVIRSLRWDKVRSAFWHHNRGYIFYGLIILAGAAAIIIVLLLPENRRKQINANQTEAAGKAGAETLSDSDEAPPEQPDSTAASVSDESTAAADESESE